MHSPSLITCTRFGLQIIMSLGLLITRDAEGEKEEKVDQPEMDWKAVAEMGTRSSLVMDRVYFMAIIREILIMVDQLLFSCKPPTDRSIDQRQVHLSWGSLSN